MSTSKSTSQQEPRFTQTIRDDIRKVKIKDDLGTEYRSLKEYYLTGERKTKLERMGSFKRFFVVPWWILKALFFKLTPFRRILLIVGIILIFLSNRTSVDSDNVSIDLFGPAMIAGLIFLFILALELKDKLAAKTELEEGRAVQNALMPERNPKVEGWDIWLYTRSANDVGGDLLDFIQLGENNYAVALGDVAGKGLSAALLMAKLQATIRALVPGYESLSNLGEKLNEIFYRDSLPKIFASLAYLEIGSKSGKIKLLNAGHIPPVLVEGNTIKQIDKDAPALGIMQGAQFNELDLQLTEKNLLFIYSDGVTEAQNEDGEFFGDERLMQQLENINDLSSNVVGEKLLSQVNDFVGKAKVHDDLTMAILKKV